MLASFFLLAATSATAYEDMSYTYNYKITVVVRDHGEALSASNVVRVGEQSYQGASLPPRHCGEATAIRLHDGQYLFALLDGPFRPGNAKRFYWRTSPTQLLLSGLGLPTQWTWKYDSGIRQLSTAKTSIQLDTDQMPLFVVFGKISDPTSIKQVDPAQAAQLLGDGVSIGSVTIQPTVDHETKGRIAHILPWLKPSADFLDGSRWGYDVRKFQSKQFVECF